MHIIFRYYKYRFIIKNFENSVLIDVFGVAHWYTAFETAFEAAFGTAWGPAWGSAWRYAWGGQLSDSSSPFNSSRSGSSRPSSRPSSKLSSRPRINARRRKHLSIHYFEMLNNEKLLIILKYHMYEYKNYWYSISSLLSIFHCIENTTIITLINEKYENNKIENKNIRVKKATFEKYENNSS